MRYAGQKIVISEIATTILTNTETEIDAGSGFGSQPLLDGWITEIHEMYSNAVEVTDGFVIESRFGDIGIPLQEHGSSDDELKFWSSTNDFVRVNYHRSRPFRFIHPGQVGVLLVKRNVHHRVKPGDGLTQARHYSAINTAFAGQSLATNSYLVQEVGCKRSKRH